MTASSPDLQAAARALSEWWAEAGVAPPPRTEPAARRQAKAPQRRSEDDARPAAREATPPPAPAAPPPEQDARRIAAGCDTLEALREAVEAFEGCALKKAARNTVFSRGSLDSGVMIVGEAPGYEEDARGEPFVGRSGVLLDKMFAAIGLDREAIYVTNILFWRPPGNRNPSEDDIRACLPFVERHVALAKPKALVFAGKLAAQTMLNTSEGIMRMRGRWGEYKIRDASGDPSGDVLPALPMLHPAFLLRQPAYKAQTWRDLLSLQKRLEDAD